MNTGTACLKATLGQTHPDLASQLVDPSLASVLTRGSGQLVQWHCAYGHTWTAEVKRRADGGTCPLCTPRTRRRSAVESGRAPLFSTHPELAAELVDPTVGATVTHGSDHQAKWRCARGHVWTARVCTRVAGRGCPVCKGTRVAAGETDLATTHPDVAAQLVDPNLATTLSAGSQRKVSWRCEKGHVWVAPPANRTRGRGCNACRTS